MLTSRVVGIITKGDQLCYTVALLERHPRRAEPDREVARRTVTAPKSASVKQVSDLLVQTEREMKS